MIRYANIYLWDIHMGAIVEDDSGRITMQYTPEFVRSGYNPSPIFVTPQERRIYEFSQLSYETFKGLPGFIADCLPDKFGTAIINRWLEQSGRPRDSYSTIERLLYQGSRSMGALRFEPQERADLNKNIRIELDGLVNAAAEVLKDREELQTNMSTGEEALLMVLRVGTSAGGARAKAVVAYNKETHDICSGQVDAPEGFEHYLLKMDGVDPEQPGTFGKTLHFGSLEYSYYLMARECGIDIMDSLLLPDNDRNHFMTKRFDRVGSSHRVHMVSLCGMNHMDFNQPRSWSYEQLFSVMRALRLPHPQIEQAFRRMVFNVVGCNQDDHTKNFSFLLDKDNIWKLSPAYDMTYAKGSGYTRQHQMSINNKRIGISRDDLLKVANSIGINQSRANEIIDQTSGVFSHFNDFIKTDIPKVMVNEVLQNLVLL